MPRFTCFSEVPSFRRWLSTGLIWLVSVSLLPTSFAEDNRDAPNSARSDPSKPTFSATVKLVNLFATVHDKHGQIISTLSKDDFLLEEDGRQQTIKYFTRETDLPLKMGLLVDTSRSTLSALPDERNASTTFLSKIMREDKDSAFVIHFDREVELLQDLTSSKEKLATAMDDIEPTQRTDRGDPGGGWPGGPSGGGRGGHRHFGGGGTLLYDAVYLASDELMQKQQGRKALILLTDGDDQGSKTSLESAIESAQRANTLVYCIYFKGEQGTMFGGYGGQHGGWGRGGMGRPGGGYPMPSPENGKKVLERIAKETGGRVFEISKKQTADEIYSQIEQELRNQYSIGYTPDRGGATSAYHKIHLAAKDKNDVVQTRDGYYD